MQPFDPTQVNFTLTEANTWQYNFFVPQDINTHIAMMGGPNEYGKKLDALFTAPSKLSGREQVDITGLIGQYAHGNEPSHNTVYMYNFVGQPTKTQHYVKQIMDEFYTDERDGLSGNEDCGQMSAWGVFSAMGFYPATPASGYYVLGLPRFDRVELHLDNGKTFTVQAKNLSPSNCYVSSVMLNGKSLDRSYITFDEVCFHLSGWHYLYNRFNPLCIRQEKHQFPFRFPYLCIGLHDYPKHRRDRFIYLKEKA